MFLALLRFWSAAGGKFVFQVFLTRFPFWKPSVSESTLNNFRIQRNVRQLSFKGCMPSGLVFRGKKAFFPRKTKQLVSQRIIGVESSYLEGNQLWSWKAPKWTQFVKIIILTAQNHGHPHLHRSQSEIYWKYSENTQKPVWNGCIPPSFQHHVARLSFLSCSANIRTHFLRFVIPKLQFGQWIWTKSILGWPTQAWSL